LKYLTGYLRDFVTDSAFPLLYALHIKQQEESDGSSKETEKSRCVAGGMRRLRVLREGVSKVGHQDFQGHIR